MGAAMLDGVPMDAADVAIPYGDPAVTHGWSVFETLAVRDRAPRSLSAHLDRLEGSCRAALIAMPDRDVLAAEIAAVAERANAPLVRVRVTLTGGGRRIVVGEAGDPSKVHAPIRAVRGAHRDDPFLSGSVKHGSRAPWIVAVRRSGVDDVLLVDDEGRFTEATTAAILAVIDGVLWTAPDDGRILASTACAEVVDRALARGIPVRREGPPARGPWDGLYIASSLRDLSPVVELDGVALAGWEPVGRMLV